MYNNNEYYRHIIILYSKIGTMFATLIVGLEVWKRLVSIFMKFPLRLGVIVDPRIDLDIRKEVLAKFLGACRKCLDEMFSILLRAMVGLNADDYLLPTSKGYRILKKSFSGTVF